MRGQGWGQGGEGNPGRKRSGEVLEDGSLLKGKDEQNQTSTFKISLATVCECQGPVRGRCRNKGKEDSAGSDGGTDLRGQAERG